MGISQPYFLFHAKSNPVSMLPNNVQSVILWHNGGRSHNEYNNEVLIQISTEELESAYKALTRKRFGLGVVHKGCRSYGGLLVQPFCRREEFRCTHILYSSTHISWAVA